MSYQKGDRVRCVDCSVPGLGRLTVGKDYEIVQASESSVYGVKIVCDAGHVSLWRTSRFVPTPERVVNVNGPFVVGDVVEVVKLCMGGPGIGSRVTLKFASHTNAGLGPTYGHSYQNNHFRLAIPSGGFKAGDLVEGIGDWPGITEGKRYVLRDEPDNCQTPVFTNDHGATIGTLGARKVLEHIRIISRPDANGWHAWTGGENPVPGMRVHVKNYMGTEIPWGRESEAILWEGDNSVVAFRIDETPKLDAQAATEEPTKIELSDLRPGDEVTVRAKVETLTTGHRPVVRLGDGVHAAKLFVDMDEIVTHTPAPLRVGDKVSCYGGDAGEIVFIKGAEAVIDIPGVGLEAWNLDELDRAA